jgi:bifunctional DNA-binding transcriptional regulator/antitoxin component of YhaV-PrlF toxin-antitoxin module
MRSVLGLAAGDRLHVRVVGTRIVIERPADAVTELRRLAAKVPLSRSLVEELLDERRTAAAAK